MLPFQCPPLILCWRCWKECNPIIKRPTPALIIVNCCNYGVEWENVIFRWPIGEGGTKLFQKTDWRGRRQSRSGPTTASYTRREEEKGKCTEWRWKINQKEKGWFRSGQSWRYWGRTWCVSFRLLLNTILISFLQKHTGWLVGCNKTLWRIMSIKKTKIFTALRSPCETVCLDIFFVLVLPMLYRPLSFHVTSTPVFISRMATSNAHTSAYISAVQQSTGVGCIFGTSQQGFAIVLCQCRHNWVVSRRITKTK